MESMKTHESQEKSVTHIQADQFGLFQNMPNPFTVQTVIAFKVPQGRNWRMCVQDAQRRAVRTFEGNEGGTLMLAWDGTDAAGAAVQTGTYICLLESGGRTDQRKMTLIR
jgi:flagellar hook assembly protein FlgD